MNGRVLLNLQLSLQLRIVVILILLATPALRTMGADGPSPPNCKEICGGVPIPYPFGLADGCYLNVPGQVDQPFKISCNMTNSTTSQLQFLNHDHYPYTIANISVDESELQVMVTSSRYCTDKNGEYDDSKYRSSSLQLPPFYVISEKNYVVCVGCNRLAMLSGQPRVQDPDPERRPLSGVSSCHDYLGNQFPKNSCNGFGCSLNPIPVGLNSLRLNVWKVGYEDVDSTMKWEKNYPCSYGFVVDQRNFTFQGNKTFDQLVGSRQELPVLVNWTIGSDNCAELKDKTDAFACKNVNAECVDRAGGYFCRCKSGYQGNPYLPDSLEGCKDIDECQNKTFCGYNSRCINSEGNYTCKCDNGYILLENNRRLCVKGGDTSNTPIKISLGVSLGFLAIVLIAFWIYRGVKIRKHERLKVKYFRNNGGDKLRKLMDGSKGTPPVQIYTENELKKATKNFNNTERIGEGAYGSVYKGTLPGKDKSVVAIKVPKCRDPLTDSSQSDQFANELMVLARITHKNVVRLLGCCFETEMPTLVYEFINNGTVYEHIHKPKDKQLEPLSFRLRLKIATETARALVYLHYDHDPQIIHRDVKTTNILVDNNFTPKLSDFGASKCVSKDQNPQATCLQGTPGYLDPEYLQSNILTEKSDVYSFGVVLVELITSQVAISNTKPKEERNLASHFINSVNKGRLHQILDLDIIKDGYFEVAEKVAQLAIKCLSLKGSERPTMKQVYEEIEQYSLNPLSPPSKGQPPHDANSPKEANTMLSTPSPSNSNDGIASADYDQSLPDDASMIKQPVDGGR